MTYTNNPFKIGDMVRHRAYPNDIPHKVIATVITTSGVEWLWLDDECGDAPFTGRVEHYVKVQPKPVVGEMRDYARVVAVEGDWVIYAYDPDNCHYACKLDDFQERYPA